MPNHWLLLPFNQALEIDGFVNWCDDAIIALSSVSWWARVSLVVPRFIALDATWNLTRETRWCRSRPHVRWPLTATRDPCFCAIASVFEVELIDDCRLEGLALILEITSRASIFCQFAVSRRKCVCFVIVTAIFAFPEKMYLVFISLCFWLK